MTYLDSALAANDEAFRLRVAACCFKLAQDVINESVPDAPVPAEEEPSVTAEQDATYQRQLGTYRARRDLALLAVNAPQIVADRFAWLCATNPSIAASVTVTADGDVEVAAPDGDLEFVVASNWSIIATRDTA